MQGRRILRRRIVEEWVEVADDELLDDDLDPEGEDDDLDLDDDDGDDDE